MATLSRALPVPHYPIEGWGHVEDAADAAAPQARKIILRTAKRIKKVEKRTLAARRGGVVTGSRLPP